MKPVEIVRIVVFGDSITASARVSRKWSDQVQRYLLEQGQYPVVFNLGVAGNTSSMGRLRVEDVYDLSPHIVFIMFGTNDAAIDVWNDKTRPRVSLEEYEANLTFLITEFLERNIQPVLMTPPPMLMTEELAKLYGKPPYTKKGFNFMLDQYVEKLRMLSQRLSVALIDLNQCFAHSARDVSDGVAHFLRDGMHPNQCGDDLIAETICDWFSRNPFLPFTQ